MAKKSIAEASSELFSLLEPFKSEERLRIIKATLTLLGDESSIETPQGNTGNNTDGSGTANTGDKTGLQGQGSIQMKESQYFEDKKPKSKIEELALAARSRELRESAKSSTREQLKSVFSEARINFDANNFGRDIDNARTAGFFNKGGSKEEGYTLSLYGQKFIDALPNRELTKTLEKPTRKKSKKSKPKTTNQKVKT